VTVSELSGNAVRQVGLISRYDSGPLSTANSPSVAFVNITTPAGGAPVLLEEDTPIQVLAPIGRGAVVTIQGDDETTVVTTGVNLGGSYFTTRGTIVEAIKQGYFDPAPEYVPRSWQQIETDWDIAHGLRDRHEEREVTTVVVVPEPVDYATGLDWI